MNELKGEIKVMKKEKKKIKNNIFSFTKVYPIFLYRFFCKSIFKTLHIGIILFVLAIPITISLEFLYITFSNKETYSSNNNLINACYFGMGISFIANALIISGFIVLNNFGTQKFTDLQSRYALLNYKPIGFFLVILASLFSYIFISDFITFLTFIIFAIEKGISFISIINWPLIFFFVISILIGIIFSAIIMIIFFYIPSVKWIGLVSIFVTTLPLIVIYNIIPYLSFIFSRYNINDVLLSFRALGYYFLAILCSIIMCTFVVFIYNKFYMWKK